MALENSSSDYELLKARILNGCLNYADQRELDYLKKCYADIINSKRRLECIKSLYDLVVILEKRAVISSENTKLLYDIYLYLTGFPYLDECPKKLHHVYNDIQGIEAETEIKTLKKGIQKLNLSSTEQCNEDSLHQKVYSIISADIGKKWKDMARGLNIKESELDDITLKHPKDLKSQVFSVFQIFEEREDKRDLMRMICNALESARRNDLRQKVEKLIFNSISA